MHKIHKILKILWKYSFPILRRKYIKLLLKIFSLSLINAENDFILKNSL